MSFFSVGIGLVVVSVVAVLACATWAIVRLTSVQHRVNTLLEKPAIRALDGLRSQSERIQAALEQLAASSARFEVVGREVAAAVESSARFAADVALTARTTEDLLDTLVPSMRGSASI
jgi:hypothetical protein